MTAPAPARLPRLAVTVGEPAGIGPELVVKLAATTLAADLIAIGDPALLERAAARCNLAIHLQADDGKARPVRASGSLRFQEVPLRIEETPGMPDPRNAFPTLHALARATDGCMAGEFDALVTAPVQKSVINQAGETFTGHTEFLAERTASEVVMMLANDSLRVALATTHLPLAAVPNAITADRLERTLRILHRDLDQRFGLPRPHIAVLGLNPHAGESGYLGREEIDVIEPAMAALREEGMTLSGPLPADTAFVRRDYDAVLAMYHDQGLPVLKSEAFADTVNITLGLPFVRTSVDHGTALDLAGSGRADASSMQAAACRAGQLCARDMARN